MFHTTNECKFFQTSAKVTVKKPAPKPTNKTPVSKTSRPASALFPQRKNRERKLFPKRDSLYSYLAHCKKTGADKTGSTTKASKTRRRSSNNGRNRGPDTQAQLHGPRRSARRSSRPRTRRAAHRRMCTAQTAPLKSRPPALASAAQLRRVSAPYWPKIAR